MGTIQITTCDICGAHMPNTRHIHAGHYGPEADPRKTIKAGFCVTFGYSHGGWGHRSDAFGFSHDCICNECFMGLLAMAEVVKKAVTARRGIYAPEVDIRDPRDWDNASDNVQRVWEDKLPSDGRARKVLRALPCVSGGED